MRKALCRLLTRLQGTRQSEVERFVLSKQPKSAAEVENLVREYERRSQRGGLFHA